ncbi:hypothetical protein AAKU67_003061 [Oxalobacteraceae bacterium GrIS 2.11]
MLITATNARSTLRANLPDFMIVPFLVSWYIHETRAGWYWRTGVTIDYMLGACAAEASRLQWVEKSPTFVPFFRL